MDSPSLSQASVRNCEKITHRQIIYYFQIIVIFIIVSTSLINLTLFDTHVCAWASLLSASIAYLLPPPKLKKDKNVSFLPNASQ